MKMYAFIKCNMEIYQNSHQAVCFCAIIVNLQTNNLLWKLDKIHLGVVERVENKDDCFQIKLIVFHSKNMLASIQFLAVY